MWLMEPTSVMMNASDGMCTVMEVIEVVLLNVVAIRRFDVPLVFASGPCPLGRGSRGLYP